MKAGTDIINTAGSKENTSAINTDGDFFRFSADVSGLQKDRSRLEKRLTQIDEGLSTLRVRADGRKSPFNSSAQVMDSF
jgi:hypothetical protein